MAPIKHIVKQPRRDIRAGTFGTVIISPESNGNAKDLGEKNQNFSSGLAYYKKNPIEIKGKILVSI